MAWGDRSRRRQELPRGWGRIRAAVLERDGGRCVLCGGVATDVDHVGDRFDHRLEALRSLCRECHKRRTWLQALEARRERRGRGCRRRLREPGRHPGLK